VISFTTRQGADAKALAIIDGPLATSLSDTTAEIRWRTNEPSTSRVAFTDGTVGDAREDTQPAIEHKIILAGLSPATRYYYAVESTDGQSSGTARSQAQSLTTLATADTSRPVIIEGPLVVGRSQNSATVAWKTDEPASSLLQVEDQAGEKMQVSSVELTTEHQLVMNNLQPGATYQYLVQSYDIRGNGPVASAPASFTTEPAADITAPRLLAGPRIIGLTDRIGDLDRFAGFADAPIAVPLEAYHRGGLVDFAGGSYIPIRAHQGLAIDEVPIFITYQPRWWFKAELLLDEKERF
jgi:chitodextrinase